MTPLMDNSSIIRTLKRGLRTQRPGAPEGVMMWTLEDLDEPSPGWKWCMKVDRKVFPNGYQGIQHTNLARESVESVEFAPDAHDFGDSTKPNESDPNRPF